jgi:hypothetical protein
LRKSGESFAIPDAPDAPDGASGGVRYLGPMHPAKSLIFLHYLLRVYRVSLDLENNIRGERKGGEKGR